MSSSKKTPVDVSQLGYRPCVGIMVINRDGLVWVGAAPTPGEAEGRGAWWQMPQGGIDEGEDPRDAALRELYEETGMRSVEIIAEHPAGSATTCRLSSRQGLGRALSRPEAEVVRRALPGGRQRDRHHAGPATRSSSSPGGGRRSAQFST